MGGTRGEVPGGIRATTVAALDVREFCLTCGVDRDFVAPPCEDGHQDACDERICPWCGEAILVGTAPDRLAAAGAVAAVA